MKLYDWANTLIIGPLLACSVLAGCSGDDDIGSSSYALSGSVSGLVGELVVTANQQTITVVEDGNFSFAQTFSEGTVVDVAIAAQPFIQSCTLTSPPSFTIGEQSPSIGIDCTMVGEVNGQVVNYYTGEAIAGATVSVAAEVDGHSTTVASAISDEQGLYRIVGIGQTARYVVAASMPGFVDDALTVPNSAENPVLSLEALQLPPTQLVQSFDPTLATDFMIDDAVVLSLGAGTLRTEGGATPTAPVTAYITILDPSADTEIMPGMLETVDQESGNPVPIESYGAMDVVFTDANGNHLNLTEGATAQLTIPLAASSDPANAPTSIPLYYYDPISGYWIEDGLAELINNDDRWSYAGGVSHFTTWNADQIYSTIYIHGCLTDESGTLLPGIRVTTSGADYNGSASALSAIDGSFSVPARISSNVLLYASSGGVGRTLTVSTDTTDLTLDDCLVLTPAAGAITLTWGENPQDLDSHFFIPDQLGSEVEVAYYSTTVTVGDEFYYLDVDDTSGFGPEIITASGFLRGTYRYVVHRYAGNSTIVDSPARVELNLNGSVRVFSPDLATGDPTLDYWHVFDLDVAENGTITIIPIQQLSSAPDLAVGGTPALRTRPQMPSKYYSPTSPERQQ